MNLTEITRIFTCALIAIHYNCGCILLLDTLKMATRVAETCQWLLCNKLAFTHSSAFVGLLKTLMYVPDECTQGATYKTNFQFVLYGCETWSLSLRKKRRLRVFEDEGLRKIFGSKRDEVTGEWRRLHMRSFMICTAHQISFG